MKPTYIFCSALGLLASTMHAQHSNELYNKGGAITIQSGAAVYVQGDVHNYQAAGTLTNNGLLEVQGNMYSDNLFQQRGTGATRLHNRTVNTTERQFIQGSYAVRGGQSQIGANDGSFYNLQLANSQGIVWLNGTGNVADVRNSVDFDPSAVTAPLNRIVTHDPTSVPANGSGYSAVFGVMNTTAGLASLANNTITTNGTTSTTDNGYIQGKLRRAIAAAGGQYGFPLGLEPSASLTAARGVQYTRIDFAANTYDVLTGYFERGSSNTIAGAPTECGGNPVTWYSGSTHGEWVFNQAGSNTGTYTMNIYPQDYTPVSYSQYFITKNNAIAGTANACGATPVGLARPGFSGFSEFGFAAVTTVLEVDLLGIDAYAVDNHYIQVRWEVANEDNISHFEIERSTDNINFQYLNVVYSDATVAHGTQAHAYTLDDAEVQPHISYYYRVKAVEMDGSYKYTPVAAASLARERSEMMQIFPNPTTGGNVTIAITTAQTREAQLSIIDVLGRKLHTQAVQLNSGYNAIDVQTTDWSAGIYYIQLVGEDFANVKELIKTN